VTPRQPAPWRTGSDEGRGGQRDYLRVCTLCNRETDLAENACSDCAGPIVLRLSPAASVTVTVDRHAEVGIWRHRHLLPRTTARVSLGEGATPLLPFALPESTRGAMSTASCWLKSEHLNPTLSFKDRAMALGVSAALDEQARGLVLASTGNAAASAAAYARAAGLPCRIFCGTGSAAGAKLAVAEAFGAQVTVVDGDYSTAYAAAVAAEDAGWVNVTTTYRNPVLAEAYRTTAAEIVADLGDAPDLVVVPVGAGPLLHGLRMGFQDALDGGHASRLPALLGVQAQACSPLATAWATQDWLASLREPTRTAPTSAGAIADALRGYEEQGLITLADARATGGAVVAVDEEAITVAQQHLRDAGHLVEPAAATALAALGTEAGAALVGPDAKVVLVMTGHGAKDMISQGAA